MIDVIKINDPNTIGFKIEGKIDDQSFKKSSNEVLKEFEDDSHFNIYMEVESVKGITFDAIWDSVKVGLNNLGNYLKQVDKIAVVTDIEWMKKGTQIENKLIPNIKEKVFSLEEKDLAKSWVSSN